MTTKRCQEEPLHIGAECDLHVHAIWPTVSNHLFTANYLETNGKTSHTDVTWNEFCYFEHFHSKSPAIQDSAQISLCSLAQQWTCTPKDSPLGTWPTKTGVSL